MPVRIGVADAPASAAGSDEAVTPLVWCVSDLRSVEDLSTGVPAASGADWAAEPLAARSMLGCSDAVRCGRAEEVRSGLDEVLRVAGSGDSMPRAAWSSVRV